MKSSELKEGTPPDHPEPPAGGRNAELDFHRQRLSNDTHQSTTDPEARLYRKGRGREAELSFMESCSRQKPVAKTARSDGSGFERRSCRSEPQAALASGAGAGLSTFAAVTVAAG